MWNLENLLKPLICLQSLKFIKHQHSCKILYFCNFTLNILVDLSLCLSWPYCIQGTLHFHKGTHMSAHVLLNVLNELGKRYKMQGLHLLNELGKRYKMRGLPNNLWLLRNEFNQSNNTRARMLDFIYHMTLKITLKSHFCCENVIKFPENL